MSELDKLLEGVDVEWKPLDEIITDKFWLMPSTPKFNEDEDIPYITSKNIKGGHINFYKAKFISRLDYIDLSRNRVIKPGDILISMIGTIGEVARVKDTDLDFYGQNMYLIRLNCDIITSDFFLHFFDSPIMKFHFSSVKNNSGQGYLKAKDIESLQIPIPPLTVQKEIVRILDTFTELTRELTRELTARKKQYSYYREQLLSFEEGEVEWKSLGEVVLSTANIRWKDTNKSFRYIDLTSVCRDKNVIIETIEITKDNAPSRAQKLILMNDVIFATTRPTQQRLCLIPEEYSGEVASTGYCVLRANNNVILPKWIYFWITSNEFKNHVEENQSGSAYPAISDAKVKEFKIPIPSLKEQERIVSILDKFDILTTSISEGLPKEIELRKKQYEYYRDLLLTFPKKETA